MNAQLLKLSLMLNVCLLTTAGYFISTRPGNSPIAARQASSLPEVAPSPSIPALNWADLESNDYATYMRNLAAIGCPTQTIHDIIKADITSLYEEKRAMVRSGTLRDYTEDQLRAEEEALSAKLLGHPTQLLAKAEIHNTKAPTNITQSPQTIAAKELEEEILADQILEAQNLEEQRLEAEHTEAQPVQKSVTWAAGTQKAVEIPLPWLEPENTPNDRQASALANLRQEFTKDLGPQPNPNDPLYQKRWIDAQTIIDAKFRAMFGDEAYNAAKIKASRLDP